MEISTIYAEEHLSEPWFTLISLGLKLVKEDCINTDLKITK